MSHQSAHQAKLAQKPLRGIEGLASRVKSHELAVETKYEQRKDGSSSAEFSLVPGPGTHYFRYKDAWFQVRKEELETCEGFFSLIPSSYSLCRSNENERPICSTSTRAHLGRQYTSQHSHEIDHSFQHSSMKRGNWLNRR